MQEITNAELKDLVGEISRIHETAMLSTADDLNKIVVASHWEIGKKICELEEAHGYRSEYGAKHLERIGKELNERYRQGFSARNLRYMRKFYEEYDLAKISTCLSFTHYRLLLSVDDKKLRKALEKQAEQERLTHRELGRLIKNGIDGKKDDPKNSARKRSALVRPKGRLGLYRVQIGMEDAERSVPHLDLGFAIRRREKMDGARSGDIVEVVTKKDSYTIRKSDADENELWAYSAQIERVIDGDTFLANVDLGFETSIRQRFRLRGIDAPESDSENGTRARAFLEERLKEFSRVVVKTHRIDRYDRYLADVLYLKKDADAAVILQRGHYLNQEMLDAKLPGVRQY